MPDEVLDVDAAVAQRAALLVGLGDLGREGDHALEARLDLWLGLAWTAIAYAIGLGHAGAVAGTAGYAGRLASSAAQAQRPAMPWTSKPSPSG